MPKPTCITEAPTSLTPTSFDITVQVTDDGGLPCSITRDVRPLFVVQPPDKNIATDAHTGDRITDSCTANFNTKRITCKHWISNADGHSFSDPVKFFLPTKRFPDDAPQFLILSIAGVCAPGYYLFTCTTDTPCTLTAHWSHLPPEQVPLGHTKRGVTTWHDIDIAFHTSRTTDQLEQTDSITHTFKIPFLQHGKPYYWYLTGTVEGKTSPSVSPLFSAACTAPPPPTVYNLAHKGEFTEHSGLGFPIIWGAQTSKNVWNSVDTIEARYQNQYRTEANSVILVRSYFVFDTTSLSPATKILHAYIHAYCTFKQIIGDDDIIYLQKPIPPHPHSPLLKEDYDHNAFGTIVALYPTAQIATSSWHDLDILPGHLDCITPGGYTNIALRMGADVYGTNTNPTGGSTDRHINFYASPPWPAVLHLLIA